MGAFSNLTTAALKKLLRRNRGKLQVLEDIKKGRSAERNFLKQDPIYRAAQGKRPINTGSMFVSAGGGGGSLSSMFPKAEKTWKKALRTTPQLRVGVTQMVKELRRRGGKSSDYRGGLTGQNAQKEINKMQRTIKKAKKNLGVKYEYGY